MRRSPTPEGVHFDRELTSSRCEQVNKGYVKMAIR